MRLLIKQITTSKHTGHLKRQMRIIPLLEGHHHLLHVVCLSTSDFVHRSEWRHRVLEEGLDGASLGSSSDSVAK